MEVAVTGGSGFIGSHVVDKLIDAGHKVRVIDVQPPHRSDAAWRAVDIMRLTQAQAALEGVDTVLHLAAMANVNDVARAPLESMELNVMATGVLLEASRLCGVTHFALASTVWVYEASDDREVDEATPLRPAGAQHLYTAEKISAEFLVNAYTKLYGLPTTVLRYGIPYGPRMREELVMPIFMKKALNGEPLTVAGDGLQYRNFVYVEDLADAHAIVVEKRQAGTFNLEGPREVAIIEVAEAVNRSIPTSAGIVRTEARSGDYQGRAVSRERTQQLLGWQPTTSFEDGFDQTLQWFLEKWSRQLQPA